MVRTHLRTGRQALFIKKQCKEAAAKLRKRRTVRVPDTPGTRENQWAAAITGNIAGTPPPARLPPWTEETGEYLEQLKIHRTVQHQKEKTIKYFFSRT